MKLFFKLVLLSLFVPMVCFSQTMRENRYIFRGPVDPLNNSLSKAKTLSVDIQVPNDFETEIHKYNGSVSISTIETILFDNTSYFDIKSAETPNKRGIEGDLKLTYNLKNFKIKGKTEISKSPAWIIGFESELSIVDREGTLIYTRQTPLNVKTYVIRVNSTLDDLVTYLLEKDCQRQFNEFSITYLRQPVHGFQVIDFEFPKKDKNKVIEKDFVDTFNQSAGVFHAVEKVSISSYNALFEVARPYWENLRKFDKSKDKDFNRDVQYASNVNLAISYLLVDQGEKAVPYIENIKGIKLSLLRTNRANDLEKWKEAIEEAKEIKKAQKGNVNVLKSEDRNLLYTHSKNTMEKLSFEGLVKNKKGEEFAGQVSILNDNPLVVDLRNVNTPIPIVGNLFSLTNAPKNTVQVEIKNKKKPERLKIDDLQSIYLADGTKFVVDKLGDVIDGTARYGILREINHGQKLSLFIEEYPNSGTILLKKTKEDNFFEIPTLINRKKLLLKYFETCPAIHANIQNGKYLDNQNSTYLMLFNDFNMLCK